MALARSEFDSDCEKIVDAAGYRMAPLHFTVHLCSLHVLFNVPCVRVVLCLWADGPRRVSRRVYHLRCDAVQANERASG